MKVYTRAGDRGKTSLFSPVVQTLMILSLEH